MYSAIHIKCQHKKLAGTESSDEAAWGWRDGDRKQCGQGFRWDGETALALDGGGACPTLLVC